MSHTPGSGFAPAAQGGSSLPVADTTAVVKGSSDATKQVKIEADSLAAGNRTLTIDAGAQTADRTIALPVVSGNDTLASRGTGNTFSKAQAVAGSADEVQLLVKAHSTQNENLQEWRNGSNTIVARLRTESSGTFKACVVEVGNPATGTDKFLLYSGTPASMFIASDACLAWDSDNDVASVAPDAGFRRAAAGVIKIDDGQDSGGGVLEFPQVASGGTPGADAARIYAKDNGGTAELFAKDEAGNETQISPHAPDSPGAAVDAGTVLPAVIKHRNAYAGIEEWIHLSALAREVERLSGKTFVFSRDIPKDDWAADQDAKQLAYDAARAREIDARAAFEALPEAEKAGRVPPVVRDARDVRKARPAWIKA